MEKSKNTNNDIKALERNINEFSKFITDNRFNLEERVLHREEL